MKLQNSQFGNLMIEIIQPMDIARKIRDLRKEKDWSQAQLGEKIGVTQRHISSWENGANLPSADALVRLSQVLRASVDYLLLDNVPREGTHKIDDFSLYDLFRQAEDLPDEEKKAIEQLLSGLVFRHKVKKAEQEADRVGKIKKLSELQSDIPTLKRVSGKR